DDRASGGRRSDPGGRARPAADRGAGGGGRDVRALAVLFRRELALAWGRGGGPLLALGFYVAAATMFPLAIPQGAPQLAAVAGPVAWVGLALASRRGGVLIALIVLPLLIPPVIFGGKAVEDFAAGLDWGAAFALLAGYALAAAALTPFAMAGACRNALS